MMEVLPEMMFFQSCEHCDKVFTQEHPYKRHVNYCRRAENQRKGRPKSCAGCRVAKTKCSFGQPCARCDKKGVRCVYGRATRNDPIAPAAQPLLDDSRENYEMQAVDILSPSVSSGLPLDLYDFTTGFDSSWNTMSTDIIGLTKGFIDIPYFNLTSDTQIHVPPRTLSSKGDLTRVSNRLSSLQHASRVIMQMLYAYPQMMLRRQTFPPFIHPHWHEKHLPDTLGNCMSIAQLFAARTPETEAFLWRMIDAEEELFREKRYLLSPREVHLCLQVMIIYMMMTMSESGVESNERVSRLFETTELIGSRFLDLTGGYYTSEQVEPSSTWEEWIFAESRRRMSSLWVIISCVITIESGKVCDGCSALDNLALPSSKTLWEARSLEEWQTEKAFYDMNNPLMTLGELVEAKKNSGNPLEAQKLQTWEMGSDKMSAMLNLAVEFVWGRVL